MSSYQVKNAPLKLLILLTVIFTLLRLATALFAPFTASCFEEHFTGVIAELLQKDTDIPWYNLTMGPQEVIGRTVIAWMCAGSFQLSGPTLIALKLPAVVISTLSFFLWHLLLSRYSTKFGIWISAALWFFPPPLIQSMYIMSFGNHWENTLNFALVLLFYFRWTRSPEKYHWLFLASLSAGFSLAFCLNAIPLVLAAGITALVFDRSHPSFRRATVCLLFFMLPLIPFCTIMYLRTGQLITLYNVSSRTVQSVFSVWTTLRRFRDFFLIHLPDSALRSALDPPDSDLTFFFQWLSVVCLFGLTLFSLVFLLKKKDTRRISFLAGMFIVFFICLFNFSGSELQTSVDYLTYRYFVVLYPFSFLLIGLMMRFALTSVEKALCGLIILSIIFPNFYIFQKRLHWENYFLARSASGENWIPMGE